MREWYRRAGILEPEYFRRVVQRKEVTGRDVGYIADRHSGETVP